MNLIICDDEKSTCVQLERIVKEYIAEKKIHMKIHRFYSGDGLKEYMEHGGTVDILFLDIELPGMDGIRVGDFIRKEMENEQMFLIYISSKEQYAIQLFKNRPFDFLVKPIDKAEIFRNLDNIFKIIGRENHFFEYRNQTTLIRIPYNDILYFQSIGKKIEIVMNHEVQSYYGKLKDLKNALPEFLFLSIHKSYIINRNYVKEYTYERITMVNDQILNISKANRPRVRKVLLENGKDL